MNATRRLILAGAGSLAAVPARAQIGTLLLSPKTLIEHATEARSFADQATDNEIVVKVNAVMAEVGTVEASTEIYEQRLLITGLFDDRAKYRRFHAGVQGVSGIKTLYWHAVYKSAEEQKADPALISWAMSLELATKAGANLTLAAKATEMNYRVCCDAFAVIYVLGRAMSAVEHRRVLAAARATSGIRKLVDYVLVRA